MENQKWISWPRQWFESYPMNLVVWIAIKYDFSLCFKSSIRFSKSYKNSICKSITMPILPTATRLFWLSWPHRNYTYTHLMEGVCIHYDIHNECNEICSAIASSFLTKYSNCQHPVTSDIHFSREGICFFKMRLLCDFRIRHNSH